MTKCEKSGHQKMEEDCRHQAFLIKAMRNPEDAFWEFVDWVNWEEVCKESALTFGLKEQIESYFDIEFCRRMSLIHEEKYNALRVKVREADPENTRCLGDDGLWDLCAHVVGLGREVYEKEMADPSLAVRRGRDLDFVENFGYHFPS